MKDNLPLISVVVCSHNGGQLIADALKAIKAQKWQGELEIIVVDDGSTDDTYKIAKSLADIKVIRNRKNIGLAASRNKGIRAAKGEIIAFTDDDCRPQPTWISQIYAGYKNDNILGVGGPLTTDDDQSITLRYLKHNPPFTPFENSTLKSKNLFQRFGIYLKNLTGFGHKPKNNRRSVFALIGGNMSFRKSALLKVGLFDERFRFGGEDVDICIRLNKLQNDCLWFMPRAKINHQLDSHLRDTLRRSKNSWGIGLARLSKKHDDFKILPYPFPIIILLSLLLGIINPWLLFTPFVLILFVYSVGLRVALRKLRGSVEPLLYGYIQFLQELYCNIGYVIGLYKFRKTFKTETVSKILSTKIEGLEPKSKIFGSVFDFTIRQDKNADYEAGIKNNYFYLEGGILAGLIGLLVWSSFLGNSVTHLPAAILAVLIPGYILMRGSGVERSHRYPLMLKMAFMSVFGLLWLILVGLFTDVIYPVFGLSHPLTSNWLIITFALATFLLIPWALRYKNADNKIIIIQKNWDSIVLYSLLSLELICSFCGARLLNNGHTNILVIMAILLGVISIVLVIFKQKQLPKHMLPLVLFSLSLASVWSYSLRSNYVFGWDIQQELRLFEHTIMTGKWALGAKHSQYDAMLSITVLPATISTLAKISGVTIYKFLVPIFYSLVPVFLFYTFKQFVKSWVSFIAAALIITQTFYANILSHAVRQEIAFLFLAGMFYLLFERKIPKRGKNLLLGFMMVGIVISHYTTTYLAIFYLSASYIISRIIFYLWDRHRKSNLVTHKTYLPGWIVIFMILSMLIWYGPATHSSGFVNKITSRHHDYTSVIKSAENGFNKIATRKTGTPESTTVYLLTIGQQYHQQHGSFTYYSGVTNSSIHLLPQILLKPKSALIKKPTYGLGYLLTYGWWVLAISGTVILFFIAWKKHEHRKLEYALLGSFGIVSVVGLEIIPVLLKYYSAERIEEQILMLVALPSIVMSVWLLRRYFSVLTSKIIITVAICGTFIFISGLATQIVGGIPFANLNNTGQDFNNFYIRNTDIAAGQWLVNNNPSDKPVYVDSYSMLHLNTVYTAAHGQLNAVTPETISQEGFVYADYTNAVLGIATTAVNNKQYNYQFPTAFLQQHKNLVYTNRYAEVYK